MRTVFAEATKYEFSGVSHSLSEYLKGQRDLLTNWVSNWDY